MTLNQFIKGDIVTRVKPSATGSYICVGTRLEYVGVANGCAYFKVDGTKLLMYVQYDLYDDEWWEYYVDPYSLLNTDEDVQVKIDKALQEEDYELAESLKKKLK